MLLKFCSRSARTYSGRRPEVLFEFLGVPGFTNLEPWKMTIDENGLAVLFRSDDAGHWIPDTTIVCRDRAVVHRIWSDLPKEGDFLGRLVVDCPQVEVKVFDRTSSKMWRADVPNCSRKSFTPFGWLGDADKHPFMQRNDVSKEETDRLILLFRELENQYAMNPRANQSH